MSALRIYDYVNHPFASVIAALAADAPGVIKRATHVAGEHGAELGAKLHVDFGPIDLATDVVLELGPLDHGVLPSGREALRLPITWHAKRVPGAFPVMKAELVVYSLTPTETQLEFVGTYDPPFGIVGRAIDSAVLHKIAEASVVTFVQELARDLRTAIDDDVAA